MTKVNPLISVVMSTRNNSRYLREAVDSILSQTFRDFEFIVINDGSTDNTKEIIESYNDDRILYIENPTSATLPVALNQGLEVAKGKYIARMDGDDIAFPNRFAKQIDFFENNPEVGILGTQSIIVDKHGNKKQNKPLPTHHNMIAWYLFTRGFALIHPSVMIRHFLLKELGGYNVEFHVTQDLELWLQCLPLTKMANLPEPLLYYRVHQSSNTAKKNKSEKNLQYRAIHNTFHKISNINFDTSTIVTASPQSYMFSLYSDTQLRLSAIYLLNLYHTLHENKYFNEDSLEDVQSDLSQMIMQLGRQSPRGIPYLWYSVKAFLKWVIRR